MAQHLGQLPCGFGHAWSRVSDPVTDSSEPAIALVLGQSNLLRLHGDDVRTTNELHGGLSARSRDERHLAHASGLLHAMDGRLGVCQDGLGVRAAGDPERCGDDDFAGLWARGHVEVCVHGEVTLRGMLLHLHVPEVSADGNRKGPQECPDLRSRREANAQEEVPAHRHVAVRFRARRDLQAPLLNLGPRRVRFALDVLHMQGAADHDAHFHEVQLYIQIASYHHI
mmetsp:Transcript_111036/g.319072  ORF Transcript_111036/g.319072 Transcript_111036/m.319072 type:complete len:226 (+) Transcript_111036:1716-2393(+)